MADDGPIPPMPPAFPSALDRLYSEMLASISEDSNPFTFGWGYAWPKPFGFTSGVCLRAYRETPEQARLNPDKYAIFSDGTRKPLKPVLANGEVRGFYAFHGEQHCFGFAYEKRPHEGAEPLSGGAESSEEPTVHSNFPRNLRYASPKAGLITFMLENGERFWRTTTDFWPAATGTGSTGRIKSDEKHEHIRFQYVEGADDDLPMVIMQRMTECPKYGNSKSIETLPMNKFLDDFNPNKSLFSTEAEERAIVLARKEGRKVLISKGAPYPFAVSELMVLKCKFAWMRLHYKAQERKFAPGGAGHKRALQSDTAKAMSKRPREEPCE